jgi:gamma-glutamyltranspeptidase / glutathione hydrolase
VNSVTAKDYGQFMLYSRALAGLTGLLLLTGCSIDLGRTVGLSSTTSTQDALVVGDEPFAVRAGAAILAQGGDAADAAAAMYFALAATYPVAAGLGGGGICIVHDPAKNQTVEFDFLATDAAAAGPYAVPGNVRGFALMQSVFGLLPWQKVVSPGETYARTGVPISKALAARLSEAADVIRLDAGLSALYLGENGQPKAAGTVVVNPQLADTLAAVRLGGPEAFASGSVVSNIVAYSQAQGGSLTLADLAAARATQTTPRVTQIGSDYVFVPAHRIGPGSFAGSLLDNLGRAQSNAVGAHDLQAAVLWAVQHTMSEAHIADLPRDLGATGFATMDARGQAVACAVTMNGPFGSGHTVRATGVTLARAPSVGGASVAATFLTPMIAARSADAPAELVGAGAGGPNGAAAIAHALARIAGGDEILTRQDLRSTGVAPYDTVNAIVCSGRSCQALPDPSANGLGEAVPVRR